MLRLIALLLRQTTLLPGSRRESGQTLVEYGMLVMLLAIVVIGILTVVGEDVVGLFTNVSSDFQEIAEDN